MFLIAEQFPRMTNAEIGVLVGRDKSAVWHARKTVQDGYEAKTGFCVILDFMRETLKQRIPAVSSVPRAGS